MEKQLAWTFAEDHETEIPIVRVSDRETSHQAAATIQPKLNGLRADFVRLLRERGEPSTANEVAQGNESLRKRARECERLGFVRGVGKRECSVTGVMATVYWVVK